MTDTFLFFSSPRSSKHERIREIKCHINQLLSELRQMEPNNHILDNFQPFNITPNSSLTTISHEKCFLDHQCPYLSCKQAKLHSTTYEEYKKVHQRKQKKTIVATSTPKHSPNENLLLKPYLTSTPRRHKRQSTNIIPLKRLLYNNNHNDLHRQRHSIKRSILPRYNSFNPIDENNQQWI